MKIQNINGKNDKMDPKETYFDINSTINLPVHVTVVQFRITNVRTRTSAHSTRLSRQGSHPSPLYLPRKIKTGGRYESNVDSGIFCFSRHHVVNARRTSLDCPFYYRILEYKITRHTGLLPFWIFCLMCDS